MSTIFPGMDPYLEDPARWVGVHNWLVAHFAEHLQPRLGPRYVAAIEDRVYVERPSRDFRPDVVVSTLRPAGKPAGAGATTLEREVADSAVRVWSPIEEIHEPYVTVLDLRNDQRLVAIIEIVSPSNKATGAGRDSYQAKQAEILASPVHLVEVDLLRTGRHVLAVPEHRARETPYDFLVCVNRAADRRALYDLYPRTLRERLARIAVPLSDEDPDVVVDLQSVLARTYEAGRYRDILRYDRPCVPPLPPEDQTWADGVIAAARTGPA